MKYCMNCGKQIDDSVSFCPFCGTSQGEQETTLLLPMVVPQPGMQQQEYIQQGYDQAGYGQMGYGQAGMQQGFGQAGMQQGYGQAGMQQGFGQAGMQQGFGQAGMQQGFGQAGMQQGAQAGYGQQGMQQGFVQQAYGQQAFMPRNAAYKKQGFFSRIPKPVLIIVPIVVVVLAVLIIFFATRRGASDYKAAVEDYFDALSSGDAGEVVDVMMPSDMEDQFYKAIESGDIDGFEYDTLEEAIEDEYDEYLDDRVEFRSIHIEDKDKISKSELKQLNRSFRTELGVDLDITAAYELDVDFQVREKGNKRWEDDSVDFVAYEVGGRWYILSDFF